MARALRQIVGSLLILTCVNGCAATASSRDRALCGLPASEIIPAATQQLMDALPADSAVWQRYMSERGIYVGEAGDIATKQELLESFMPFPEGLAGSIKVRTFKLTDFGGVAVHVFHADEKQTVYNQQIEVSYLSTHTWRCEDGEWRLIAAQNLVLARDPAALPVAARLEDYAGTYDLAGKRRYRIEQRGEGLVGGREGGELTPLIPVGDNVFVDSGSNLGILRIFVRDANGTVQRMVQRRKFADVTWLKVAPNP